MIEVIYKFSAPMDFKLVTRYYKNGDLRQFLQQEHFQDKEAFLNQMVLGILQGLSYLEDQRVSIFAFCLNILYFHCIFVKSK